MVIMSLVERVEYAYLKEWSLFGVMSSIHGIITPTLTAGSRRLMMACVVPPPARCHTPSTSLFSQPTCSLPGLQDQSHSWENSCKKSATSFVYNGPSQKDTFLIYCTLCTVYMYSKKGFCFVQNKDSETLLLYLF